MQRVFFTFCTGAVRNDREDGQRIGICTCSTHAKAFWSVCSFGPTIVSGSIIQAVQHRAKPEDR